MYTIAINISEENFKKYSRPDDHEDVDGDNFIARIAQLMSNIATTAALEENNGVIDISPEVFDNMDEKEENIVRQFFTQLGGVVVLSKAYDKKIQRIK